MRKVLLIILAVVLVLCGVGGYYGYRVFDIGRDFLAATITQQQFDAQAVGTAETSVRAALPAPLEMTEADIYDGNDAARQGRPDGASCMYYGVKPLDSAREGELPVFRFCFQGGKLTEKKKIILNG
ncbi:hypothetical protein [Jidongwangia harbinensis]|uniref:hypothetical protein n=1 Tax=Jidongwangia harbinensis TaxID=2878561 RepID=UPI001CD94AED|nr:hypothetical protein [Jidongwangia harbinensis]MCA2212296.1 hypothetical protein [Jidongwangia harbinensis]